MMAVTDGRGLFRVGGVSLFSLLPQAGLIQRPLGPKETVEGRQGGSVS